jgi:CubicO group peptidase (beta-lactamase class C family)
LTSNKAQETQNMSIPFSVTTAALIAVFVVVPADAQDLPKRMASRFEPAVQDQIENKMVPGLSVAVVLDGKPVYVKAFGVKNVDNQAELTTDSLFHWASVTKPFVATAIMQLVEQDQIKLDDPVVQYLPYFKVDDQRSSSITIGQMVTHTSGMPDVINYQWDKPVYDDGALERYVRSLSAKKLIAAPGEKRRYSNMAFEVLGDVIAKVSGMTFEDYVNQHILVPLGMTMSTLLKQQADETLLTSPHTVVRKEGQKICVVRKHWPYNRMHAPSSTMISNVHDMARWAIVNLNRGQIDGKRILKASSYDTLWQPQSQKFPGIGLSWFLSEHKGFRTVSHGGGDRGFSSNFVMVPEENLAVLMVSNTDKSPVQKLTKLALDIALETKDQ